MAKQGFTREEAEALVREMAIEIPEGVSLGVTDIGEGDKYQYSFIAFRMGYNCVCTANTLDDLGNLERFIELMAGFTYPPTPFEPEPIEVIPLHNDAGQYVDEHGRPYNKYGRTYARDLSGNITENEPSEKYARPFDPGYIPVEPGDDHPF